MPRIQYIEKAFQPATLAVIRQAEAICSEYAAQGYDLTLRQLYYQFVARDLIPNRQSEYKRLGSIVNDARLAGLLDWDYIVDRTRNLRSLSHWDDPGAIMRSAAGSFATERWADQDQRVEVWIEKDALVGVIAGICDEEDVPYFSCRGYTSQSEAWGAAQRISDRIENGQGTVILHLGDHDPSGIDMTRDIRSRLSQFIAQDYINAHADEFEDGQANDFEIFERMSERCNGAEGLVVDRVALNWDQIEEFGPPPNPAKLSDSRARDYVSEYGPDSWELDALDPATLSGLIADHVTQYRDEDRWEAATAEQEAHREVLVEASRRWEDVANFLMGEQGVGRYD